MDHRLPSRPNYGIDAPGVVITLGGFGMAMIGFFAGFSIWLRPASLGLAVALWSAGSYGGLFLGLSCYMIYSSKVGKVRGRNAMLDLVPWTGTEAVLDVGCGRGLLVVAAAKRVPAGRVIGIDIWNTKDQSGNCLEAALANARLEGVEERVVVQTADMRQLPFDDASFDRVVSHWAVHNLPTSVERARAISEMVRVVRPGGYLLLVDIQFRTQYAAEFTRLGLADIRQSVNSFRDAVLAVVTNGHFRPAATIARKVAPNPLAHGT